MADLVTCLETVVGLSDSTCNCYDTGRPGTESDSLSGYYLTDMNEGIPLRFLGTSADCETGGAWDILTKARNEGLRDFISDLSDASREYRGTRKNLNTTIGNANYSGLTIQSKTFNVVKWVPYASSRDAWALIEAISLNVDTNGAVDVKLYSSADLVTPILTETITAVADTWVKNPLGAAVEIPLYQNDCKLSYFWVYDRTGIQAANNTLHCGCGSIATKKVNADWLEYFEAFGMTTNDVADLSESSLFSGGNGSMGLQIHARVGCRSLGFLCDMEYDFDRGTDYSRRVAKAIQLRGAAQTATYVIQSREINRYTMMEREVLYGKRASMIAKYNDIIIWLAANLPEDQNDCFVCNQKAVKMVTAKL